MSDLLKEYEILRAEINENSRLIAAVFTANTTVTSVIIGYGLANPESQGPLFLAPFAILLTSLFFITSQLESTTLISQYLRIILEPQLEVQWQTNWYELRKQSLLPSRRKYVPAVSGLYGALAFVCIVLAFIYWKPHQLWAFALVVLLLAVPMTIAIFGIKRAFSMDYREKIAAAWTALQKNRKQTNLMDHQQGDTQE